MLHGISAIFPPQKEHKGRKGSDSLRKTLHRQGLFVTQVKLTLSPAEALWHQTQQSGLGQDGKEN